MRSAKTRTTYRNNLIILCEGSDTEFNYFTEIKNEVLKQAPERFSSIKIVPVESERIKTKNSKRKGKKLLNTKYSELPHYWCLHERSEEEYELYKKQPTRYVRETQLYMEEYGYTEGWAVFDKDIHPDHPAAFELANSIPNLNIAFSSYSFEEWLLAHYERNKHPYSHSECIDGNDLSKKCGSGVKNDCNGEKCLGGRIRAQKFIPDYTKNNKVLFQTTSPKLKNAYINAAWLRHLETKVIYERNPYTNVDLLVKHLLGDENIYEWKKLGEPFNYEGTQLRFSKKENNLHIENIGNKLFIIHKNNIFWCENDWVISSCICKENINLEPKKETIISIANQNSFILLLEGCKYTYIEL